MNDTDVITRFALCQRYESVYTGETWEERPGKSHVHGQTYVDWELAHDERGEPLTFATRAEAEVEADNYPGTEVKVVRGMRLAM